MLILQISVRLAFEKLKEKLFKKLMNAGFYHLLVVNLKKQHKND